MSSSTVAGSAEGAVGTKSVPGSGGDAKTPSKAAPQSSPTSATSTPSSPSIWQLSKVTKTQQQNDPSNHKTISQHHITSHAAISDSCLQFPLSSPPCVSAFSDVTFFFPRPLSLSPSVAFCGAICVRIGKGMEISSLCVITKSVLQTEKKNNKDVFVGRRGFEARAKANVKDSVSKLFALVWPDASNPGGKGELFALFALGLVRVGILAESANVTRALATVVQSGDQQGFRKVALRALLVAIFGALTSSASGWAEQSLAIGWRQR